jgi:hypothetical protein
MIQPWDIIIIHWIEYVVMLWANDWYYLNNRHWLSNDVVFRKLWIENHAGFCWVHGRWWTFPFHPTLEELNQTIEKLKTYWTETDIYKLIW